MHVRCKICVSKIQSLLLLKPVKVSHLGENRIKQSYESKRLQLLVLQLRQKSSQLARAFARLLVMLARAIFRSCWRFFMCVDTRKCDRTCHRAWTVKASLYITASIKIDDILFFINECLKNHFSIFSYSKGAINKYYQFHPLLLAGMKNDPISLLENQKQLCRKCKSFHHTAKKNASLIQST